MSLLTHSFKHVVIVGALIAWVLLTLGGLAYSSAQRQKEFDPAQTLALAAMSAEFAPAVTTSMHAQYPSLAKTVVHIQQADCSCNFSNNIHVDRIDTVLDKSAYHSVHVSVSDIPKEIILPSLPAVMVFDEQGQLGYFGPYSSGYFCSTETAFVDRFLTNVIENKHVGSAVVSDGYGCYCANASTTS